MKTVSQLVDVKQEQTKISMVTTYDFPSAKQVETADIDMILVGDSPGTTVLGHGSTVQVTLADMIHHGRAIRRGAPDTFVVIDIPIGAIGISMTQDLNHALELYQETNANAVKAEEAHITPSIEKTTAIDTPVIAHLGLIPQSVGVMGYKLQGATKEAAEQLILGAKNVEQTGAVALVLEAIPSDLAEEINKHLIIPIADIGAKKDTGGQVLVYRGILNYGVEHEARFVKQLADFGIGVDGLGQHDQEVGSGVFPSEEYAYKKKIINEVNNND